MSNLYQLGLGSGGVAFPEAAEHLRNRAGEIIAGVSMMRRGGARMYEIGALQKQVPVDRNFQDVVQWGRDAGMGILLFIGLFVAVSALSQKDRQS